MKNSTLRDKDLVVFQTIVENYLKDGQPVSSGSIHAKNVLHDSPATLRNIMAKLEELGFLTQPHASSGRVPTDKGLRFYVSRLLDEEPRAFESRTRFDDGPAGGKGDFNALLLDASRLLAEQSDSVGFVLSPRVSRMNFHHLRFIKIAAARVMVLLVTTFHMVLTEIVSTETDFTQTELDRGSQYINQNFAGKNLSAIRDYLLRELPAYKSQFDQAFAKLMGLLKASVTQEEREQPIFVQGAAKLIDKFEQTDLDTLKTLFQNFEEKAGLARLLSDFIALDKVKVVIGDESNVPQISECALVLSHYGDNRQILGSLGIIGPKRIPYKTIIPLVDNVAKRLSRTISHNPS